MSIYKCKTLVLDGVEYMLVPKDREFYLNTDDLAQTVKLSKDTIYKAKSKMTSGVHYSKPNGGKILFSDKAVDFLLKGDHRDGKNESKQRECISKEGQPVSLSEFLS